MVAKLGSPACQLVLAQRLRVNKAILAMPKDFQIAHRADSRWADVVELSPLARHRLKVQHSGSTLASCPWPCREPAKPLDELSLTGRRSRSIRPSGGNAPYIVLLTNARPFAKDTTSKPELSRRGTAQWYCGLRS